MIEIKKLSFSYDEKPVLNNLSLELKCGKITSLLGANGSGKTTLLQLITKNLRAKTGEILIACKNIEDISLKSFAKSVAIVHQKNTAPEDITVERLVSYGRLPYTSMLKSSLDEENQTYVERALKLTDMETLRHRELGSLSGGQRQRAFIAMALAQNTEILLLDEPTTFLDVRYQLEILRLVESLNRDEGITIIMVLHDINQALHYSDEVVGLKDGEILFSGKPEKVINAKSIEGLYGISLPVIKSEEKLYVLTV